MKSTFSIILLVLGGCFFQQGCEHQTGRVKIPKRENFHLFLLVGQSNMAGRGSVSSQDSIPHPRVLAFNQQYEWVHAVDPSHFDKSVAGVGPGRAFGITLAEHSDKITVGLIPCAVGGSPISSWQPGQEWQQTKGHPYDDAIRRAKMAMRDGVLKAILWHQGESDCQSDLANQYKQKLAELIERFRTDLETPEVPFLIGQLGQFKESPWDSLKQLINDAHIAVANELKNVYFVSSQGLTCKPDLVHFDARSARELGRRYAEEYLKISLVSHP